MNKNLKIILLNNTQRSEIFFIVKEKQLNYSSVMNHIYTTFLNGGNNYLAKVKEKIIKEFFLRLHNLQQIYMHWVNIYKTVGDIYLKLYYILNNQNIQ